jgi:hypothetical protein
VRPPRQTGCEHEGSEWDLGGDAAAARLGRLLPSAFTCNVAVFREVESDLSLRISPVPMQPSSTPSPWLCTRPHTTHTVTYLQQLIRLMASPPHLLGTVSTSTGYILAELELKVE